MSFFLLAVLFVSVNNVHRVIFDVGWLVPILGQIDFLVYEHFMILIDMVKNFSFIVIGLIVLVFAWKLDGVADEYLQVSDSLFFALVVL